MLSLDCDSYRRTQPLHRTFLRCAAFLGACLGLILPLLAEAGSVSQIYGGAVTLPSSIEPLCAAPAVCPDFWDLRPTEGSSVIYGSRGNVVFGDTSCYKSIDGGRTFTLCPTAYPVTTMPREIDIPSNGAILSMRFEAASDNRCLLDKSTDGGVSWTQITIVAGANLLCAPPDTSGRYLGEKLRCVGTVCLALVRFNTTARTDIYRSTDNGDTWALVSTGVIPVACAFAQSLYFNGAVGISACETTTTGAVDSTRISTDSGATWTYIVPPINIALCGYGATLSGFDTGFAQACYNSTLTGFRFMSSNAVGLTPTVQPVYTYSSLSNAGMISLDTDDTWIFALADRGRVYKVNTSGDAIYEIPESVNNTFADGRLVQGRVYQGALMVTTVQQGTNQSRFSLLQGN